MILTLDIGNTNIKIGLFKGTDLVASWRLSTEARHTADEYGMTLYDLLRQSGFKFSDIKGIVMSSVAPALNYTIEHMCEYYMKMKPLVITSKVKTGITIDYDNPKDLGSDRLVGVSAAYHFYGGPVITVDFGSATTFNLVTADGTFIGGA
ncbi:MAG: type III pantothenate kinase, partial [Clostridia bacterium]|nr:type III pantothenate kinase [Clostridia bacterium]